MLAAGWTRALPAVLGAVPLLCEQHPLQPDRGGGAGGAGRHRHQGRGGGDLTPFHFSSNYVFSVR